MHRVTETLTTHYDACLATHGANARGMDWGEDPDRLTARFDAVCRAIGMSESQEKYSILDVGCGCGLLRDHLEMRFSNRVTYTGLDASPAMLEAARQRHPEASFVQHDIAEGRTDLTCDWVVANGLLTERRGTPEVQMIDFAHRVIENMFQCCQVGIVFNVLSSHVNFRDESLFYWDPGAVIEYVTTNLSRHISIHHDLETYDYFCCIRREPQGGTGDG